MESFNKKKSKPLDITLFASIAVPLCGVWFLRWAYYDAPLCRMNELGTFGDFFNGTIGPFLTFTSIILLWSAYRIQKRELAETTLALKNQYNAARLERIENMCFKLLGLYQQDVSNFSHSNHHGKTTTGAEGLKWMFYWRGEEIRKQYGNEPIPINEFGVLLQQYNHYDHLKQYTYKFLAIFKFLEHADLELSRDENTDRFTDYLSFAINNQLNEGEWIMVKTVILFEPDLNPMVELLRKYGISCTHEDVVSSLYKLRGMKK